MPERVFVKINGVQHYLWRAIDHEGEVLECFVTRRRNKNATLKFLKKALKRYGSPDEIVTDLCPSYGAALRDLGIAGKQVTGRYLNNFCETSHQPFRRREQAMLRFRSMESLQKFASIHASIYNHFNQGRHLSSRYIFKRNRDAALTQWLQLGAA